jgi:GNAT superfamily N-acetyltransferase
MFRDTIFTSAGSLNIVQVGPDALDQIMALMQEAADWLQAREIRQWRRMHSDEGRAFVAARFATDDVFLVYQGETPVATFTLRWEESTMWGEAGFDGQAGYLHGFTVSRRIGGQGVGMALLVWAAARVAVRGRRYLRLNTASVTGNPGICRYYERAGFRSCGEAMYLGGPTALYEREIGEQA